VPERLDRVHVQLARRREPFELPWDSRDKLLNEIRQRESAQPIVDAFENAGASRPVTFTLEQKAQLFDLLEAWRIGSLSRNCRPSSGFSAVPSRTISTTPPSKTRRRRRAARSRPRLPPVNASRLDRVQVSVAGQLVEITWDERDTLLRKLLTVAGSDAIIAKFEAVGASRPVELEDAERAHLRVTLELWGVSVLPDGLARLLIALVRVDPGGHVGVGFVDG
jgi:hypothetical protein